MKITTYFLLTVLSITLSAQAIELKKGDRFTYHSSTFEEKTWKDAKNEPTSYLEEYTKEVFEIEILNNSKNQIQLKLNITLSESYSRSRKANSQLWSTDKYNYQQLGTNFNRPEPDGFIMDLNRDGGIEEYQGIFQDSIYEKKIDVHAIENYLPINFLLICKSLVKGDKYFSKNKEFDPVEVSDEYVKYVNTSDGSTWLFDNNGRLLEVQNNSIMKNQWSSSSLNGQKKAFDSKKISNTHLIKTYSSPFLASLYIDNEEIDTVLTNTNVRVRGKAKHALASEEIFLSWTEHEPNNYYRYHFKVKTAKDGSFEFRITLDKMSSFKLGLNSGQSFDLILYPGDDLTINLDAKEQENYTISGIGAQHVSFMFDKTLFERKNALTQNDFRGDIYDGLLDLTPEQMKSRTYALYHQKQEFLNQYKTTLPPEVYLREYWTYRMQLESVLNEYYDNVRYFGRKKGKSDYNLPNNRESYFDFDSLIHPDNDLMSFVDDYDHDIRAYVFFHLDNNFKRLSGAGNSIQVGKNFFNAIYQERYEKANSYFSGITQYSLKYSTVLDAMEQAEWTIFEKLYNRFISEYPNTIKSELLTEAYSKAASIQPGQPAFNFELKDFEGNTVRLSDFKGKAVHLHFWDPGCCHVYIDEYGERLDSIFSKMNNVVIVYIALNSDVDRAKSFFENKTISGPKLVANRKESNQLMERFYFNSLSNDIVIDPAGLIYNETAPTFQTLIHAPHLLTDALDPG